MWPLRSRKQLFTSETAAQQIKAQRAAKSEAHKSTSVRPEHMFFGGRRFKRITLAVKSGGRRGNSGDKLGDDFRRVSLGGMIMEHSIATGYKKKYCISRSRSRR